MTASRISKTRWPDSFSFSFHCLFFNSSLELATIRLLFVDDQVEIFKAFDDLKQNIGSEGQVMTHEMQWLKVLSRLSKIWCLVHVCQQKHLQHVANCHFPHQGLLTEHLEAGDLKYGMAGMGVCSSNLFCKAMTQSYQS